MLIIGASFLAALVVVATRLIWFKISKLERTRRLSGLELRPNCLLTRHPIAFLTTSPTITRFFDDWHDVPLFLREHGYEVLVIDVPASTQAKNVVIEALDLMREKCHVIASQSHEATLAALAKHKHPMAVSLTLVTESARHPSSARNGSMKTAARLTVNDLKPLDVAIERFQIEALPSKKIFAFEERILDLAISLAERDAMMSD